MWKKIDSGMMYLGNLLLGAVLVNFCWVSATTAQTVPTGGTRTPNGETAPGSVYVIGPGDQLMVRVFRQNDFGGQVRVGEDGNIQLPFLGMVKAAGLSETELAESIQKALSPILRRPAVSVAVTEYQSRQVLVMGAVKNPGRFPIYRTERILDLLGRAGGMNENAGKVVFLVHKLTPVVNPPTTTGSRADEGGGLVSLSTEDLLNGDPRSNLPVEAGDLISIPEADTIYVTGNVNKPGSFTVKSQVTITQALALAGGLSPTAQRSHISLVRCKSGAGDRQEILINLKDLEKGKIQDQILQANDVIYVRGSETKSIAYGFLRALTTGLGSAAGLSVFR